MNFKILAVSFVVAGLFGCASTKQLPAVVEAPKVVAIQNQTLSTNIAYNNAGVKIEWNCAWPTGVSELTCMKTDIKAVEVTSVAPAGGGTQFERRNAFTIAEMQAKAVLVEFMRQEITSKRVTNTMGKNLEKANDRIKQRITGSEEVSMSDDEASKDTNFAIRENTNETVRNLTESISTYAQGRLEGVFAKDMKVVGPKEVQVTVRWSKENQELVRALRKSFGN